MSSIAVLIPTYDRPAKLDRALRSCFAQSVPPGQVLIIDNGINPETPKIATRYQAKYGECVVYRQSEHFDVRAALATGIGLASGEWLIQLDDDDYLVPGRIEQDLEILPALPPDVVMLAHHFLRVDYREKMAWVHRVDAEKLTLQNALCFDHFGPLAMATWRTAAVKAHHPYHHHEGTTDYDFLTSLLFNGRVSATDQMSYVQDDTRDAQRITLGGIHTIRAIEIHAERYREAAALVEIDHAYVERRLTGQVAFHAGKTLRGRAIFSRYAAQIFRHPMEYAKGLLAPLRPMASRLLPYLMPTIRGSRQYSFEQLRRERPALAAWVKENDLAAELRQ